MWSYLCDENVNSSSSNSEAQIYFLHSLYFYVYLDNTIVAIYMFFLFLAYN